jgi:hypothetical protein
MMISCGRSIQFRSCVGRLFAWNVTSLGLVAQITQLSHNQSPATGHTRVRTLVSSSYSKWRLQTALNDDRDRRHRIEQTQLTRSLSLDQIRLCRPNYPEKCSSSRFARSFGTIEFGNYHPNHLQMPSPLIVRFE